MTYNNPCHYSNTKSGGFTLIEMALVLVIIGLLAGVILAATSLIQSSRIRSVIADTQRIIEAVNIFQSKYKSLPGDMANAESYWGTDAACPNSSTTQPKIATCNGTGDGRIDENTGSVEYERFRAFQHLSNAGLIAGTYTGVTGSINSIHSAPGVNVLASQIPTAGFTIRWIGRYGTGDPQWFASENYRHVILFGTVPIGVGDATEYPVLTSSEAYNIDKKMDDGLPAYGSVMAWKPATAWQPGCTTSATESAAAYLLSSPTAQICSLIFKMGI